MEILWDRGASSIREIQEALPGPKRPYTSVQNFVYRLEAKQAISRAKKISTAHIWEASIGREAWERLLVEELVRQFGGRSAPILVHLMQLGKLTPGQMREAEREGSTPAACDEGSPTDGSIYLADIDRQLRKLTTLWRRWKTDHADAARPGMAEVAEAADD